MTTKIRSSILKVYKLIAYFIGSLWIQLAAASATYGMIVILYLILHFIVGERLWLVSGGNNMLHLLTMFCVPGLLITLISRQYRFPWALYLIPGTIAFFVWYGDLYLPSIPPEANADSVEITVITYNVAKKNDALSFITNDGFNADIIGVQEAPGSDLNTAKFARISGEGIYTLYPIVREEPDIIYRIGDDRVVTAVRVEVNVEGQIIALYSLHGFRPTLTVRPFNYNSRLRTNDIQAVADVVAEDPYPVILFCDCNFSDKTDDYNLLASLLTDSWRERGLGLGLTSIAPAGKGVFPFLLLRSDYIWHSDDFETVSIEVLPLELSDHYPVRARLRFRQS